MPDRRRPNEFIAEPQYWPRRATLWHDESTIVAGNVFTITANSSAIYDVIVFQSPAANADSFTSGFLLRPGTYTFSVLGYTDTTRGIIDWYIDDVLALAGQDWYAGAGAVNVVKTGTVQVKGASPYHKLTGVVNGKNASSSDYFIVLTKMWFKPSAD